MKILVSACLLGKNCKYSGGNNAHPAIAAFLEGHKVIPVCPETMGGLPTPRDPAEIVNGIVINKKGISVDDAYHKGAETALAIALREQPALCLLQSRSPSCGTKEIYDGSFTGTLKPGMGIAAALLHAHGFRLLDSEEVIAAYEKERGIKPMYIQYMETPVGELMVAADETALLEVRFTTGRSDTEHSKAPSKRRAENCSAALQEKNESEEAEAMRLERPKERKSDLTRKACRELSEYFAGKRRTFDLPLRLEGTPFQEKCWKALTEIPYGETVSYGEQAARIGNKKACRAVGGANHENPISIIVPCHRVIGANGSMTGYGGGISRKEFLLALEKRNKR